MKSTSVRAACLLLSGLLLGCTQNNSDLNAFVASTKQQVLAENKQITQTIPELPKPVVYQRTLTPNAVTQVAGDPLKAYPVASYVFTGTLTRDEITLAYLMAPDKLIYPVKLGDAVGDQGGKVTLITEDHLDITETTADNKPKVTSLQLKG